MTISSKLFFNRQLGGKSKGGLYRWNVYPNACLREQEREAGEATHQKGMRNAAVTRDKLSPVDGIILLRIFPHFQFWALHLRVAPW